MALMYLVGARTFTQEGAVAGFGERGAQNDNEITKVTHVK